MAGPGDMRPFSNHLDYGALFQREVATNGAATRYYGSRLPGRSTIYALIKGGKFPPPIQIHRGPHQKGRPMNRFVESEIEGWIKDQASARDSGKAA